MGVEVVFTFVVGKAGPLYLRTVLWLITTVVIWSGSSLEDR